MNSQQASQIRVACRKCFWYVLDVTDNVQNAMFEFLKRIQTDVSDIKGRVQRLEDRVERMDGRLERVESLAVKQRRDSAAMLVMFRGTVGVFDERMQHLEADVRELKNRAR
jgi:hypothetical protein